MDSEKVMLFKVSNSIYKQLSGLYAPVHCLKYRQENPDMATSFRHDDIPKASDLFAGQTDQLQEWLATMTSGTQMLKTKAKEVLDATQCSAVCKWLATSVVASGADWQCTNIPDMMFGKLIIALAGSTFVAGCPVKFFADQIETHRSDITTVSEKLGQMSREDVVKNGGFTAFMSVGDALCIPPGFIIFQCNVGCVELENAVVGDGGKGCDFMASWLRHAVSCSTVGAGTSLIMLHVTKFLGGCKCQCLPTRLYPFLPTSLTHLRRRILWRKLSILQLWL